jgi:dolichol-phosphate mannosyltransferase
MVGKSRWTFAKKLTYLLDSLMSYSFLPMRLMSLIGSLAATCGFIYAFIILISSLVWGSTAIGWAPIMVVILVLGGFQMLMLGIIGEYLWRTLNQVRNRDFYIIDVIYDHDGEFIPGQEQVL